MYFRVCVYYSERKHKVALVRRLLTFPEGMEGCGERRQSQEGTLNQKPVESKEGAICG